MPSRTWVEHVMGLPVSVLGRGDDPPSAGAAVAWFFEELHWVDELLSPYRDDSQVSRIARGELALAAADPVVQEVAAACDEWRARTGGLFDAVRPDGRWDPSGYVKGWAVERAAARLPAGLDWCVNAGGDVVVRGAFTVGVEDPLAPGRVAIALPVTDGAVATSGTAARGEHLYDPRTGAPATGLASLTVLAPTLVVADVVATAAFVDGSLRLVSELGLEGLAMGLDGARTTTTSFPQV